MEALIATGHFVGALLATLLFTCVVLAINGWITERSKQRVLQELSVRFGVPVKKLNSEQIVPKIIAFHTERFSSELLRNRRSDLCGVVRDAWGWLAFGVQIVVLLGVAWYTVTDDLHTVLAISIFAQIATVTFSVACYFVTGRWPGQAKIARKEAAAYIAKRPVKLRTRSEPVDYDTAMAKARMWARRAQKARQLGQEEAVAHCKEKARRWRARATQIARRSVS